VKSGRVGAGLSEYTPRLPKPRSPSGRGFLLCRLSISGHAVRQVGISVARIVAAAEQATGVGCFGSMKDPILLMVGVAIVCIVGVLVYGTVTTIDEHNITAVPNDQTHIAQHR
jgi:hypothetical protein